MRQDSRTRVIVEIALTLALAAVLHFVAIWQMPAGGTVSLEMLPILVLALRRGPAVGVVAGALFGVVDVRLEPYVVHWVQFLLDYPVAFGLLGLAGIWAPAWRRSLGSGRTAQGVSVVVPAAVVTGALGRYVAHFVSGVIFFATSVLPKGTQSAFANLGALKAAAVYSFLYQLTYIGPSTVACLVAAALVLPALERVVPSKT